MKDIKEIIKKCTDGDRVAWEEFVQTHIKFIFKIISNRLALSRAFYMEHDVPDIAQEVFESLIEDNFKRLKSFNGDCQFSTWLAVVAGRFTINYLKSNWKGYSNRKISLEEVVRDENDHERVNFTTREKLKEENCNQLDKIENEELRNHIQSTVEELPAKQKMIIKLFFLEEKQYSEISNIMKISEKTVASCLFKARSNLKMKLAA